MLWLRYIPNAICILRIALVFPTVQAIAKEKYLLALILFLLAALSDAIDGFLAKRFGWTSSLGKVLDPTADKILLVTVFLQCTWSGLLPAYIAAVAIGRDIMITLGAVVFRLWLGPIIENPSIISKINTGAQILLLVSVLIQRSYGFPSLIIISDLMMLVLITTLLSGGHYLVRFVRRAWFMPETR